MVKLQVTKTADVTYLFYPSNNTIKYSIIVTNIGDEVAYSIKVRDLISQQVYINLDSIKLNGCTQGGYNLTSGISIGSLNPGANSIISFEIYIDKNNIPNNIYNKALVSYLDCQNNVFTVESNELAIPIINIDVCTSKKVDKKVAQIGDVLEYYILIKNNSTIAINDVIFYDIMSSCGQIIPSSVIIGSKVRFLSNLNNGVNIGTINANSSLVITFQVAVTCMCSPSTMSNVAKLNYSYTILDNGVPVTSIGESTSNTVLTKILEGSCC